jgi:hypothetical protein
MKEAWLVVRELDDTDPRFWIFEAKEDALALAERVSNFWLSDRSIKEKDILNDLMPNTALSCEVRGLFKVYVTQQTVYEPGEGELVGG